MNQPRKLTPGLQSMLHSLATNMLTDPDAQAQFQREARMLKIEALRDRCQRMCRADLSQFRPGTLVQWQPGLKDCKWPQYGEAAVVVERFDPPVLANLRNSGSPYFREPLTLLLGMMHEGYFDCWYFDGRRFERVPGS